MASTKKKKIQKDVYANASSPEEVMSDGVSSRQSMKRFFTVTWKRTRKRVDAFLVRRPHRSFKQTMRRDYARELRLPGYWSFTNYVRKVLAQHKRLFFGIVIFYGVLTLLLVGLSSQDAYTTLADTLRSTGSGVMAGNWGEIGKASLLLTAGITGGFNSPLSEAQQVYAILIFILTWLTTVWVLRSILSGGKPKLRDGLYSAGAPILSTFVVGLVVVAQLLPVALAAAGFAAVVSTGMLNNGVESMVFWATVLLLVALSLYWITSTFIALIVVTLPGMYPMDAIKIAGDLVIGRRLRILLRMLWLAFITLFVWFVIMVPVILFDAWLKGIFPSIQWIPIVPACMLIMTSFTVAWVASYIYLLYRKVVDDDASPA